MKGVWGFFFWGGCYISEFFGKRNSMADMYSDALAKEIHVLSQDGGYASL